MGPNNEIDEECEGLENDVGSHSHSKAINEIELSLSRLINGYTS